ncbi:MAG: hypothetical protein HY586_05665 [Candidatus Omnitrophica bacterium]|nr:hypothetical protein [Candidatus Omnitrophota bacterium]
MKKPSNRKTIIALALGLQLFFGSSLYGYDIEGTVEIEAPYPKPIRIQIPEQYIAECETGRVSPRLKISSEGNVANAVIELKGVPEDSFRGVEAKEFTLDQNHCEFLPHALIIPKGGILSILNSENVLHNVRVFDEKSLMLFNVATPAGSAPLKKQFNESGRFLIRCGLHHWMHALVIVQGHPFYALTDESGHFKISGVPDGNYTLTVWHEALGELAIPVDSKNSNIRAVYPVYKK